MMNFKDLFFIYWKKDDIFHDEKVKISVFGFVFFCNDQGLKTNLPQQSVIELCFFLALQRWLKVFLIL